MQETRVPGPHMYGCGKDCLILIPCRLPQISCFTVSLKCFSSDSDPLCGDRTPASVPPPLRAGPVLLTLLFFLIPSSYRVLCGSTYSFPLVRCSCLLSAGVLHALLWLKVYFWCIHGERCTPHPPIPALSCSLHVINLNRESNLSCVTFGSRVDWACKSEVQSEFFYFLLCHPQECSCQMFVVTLPIASSLRKRGVSFYMPSPKAEKVAMTFSRPFPFVLHCPELLCVHN